MIRIGEMVLVLLIGDLHIPHRASALPQAFKSLLVPGRIQHVLCTGDLCNRCAHGDGHIKTLTLMCVHETTTEIET